MYVIVGLAVLIEHQLVTDGWTDTRLRQVPHKHSVAQVKTLVKKVDQDSLSLFKYWMSNFITAFTGIDLT